MQCVILAAGQGTRMGNVTKKCPKPMLPIKGRPKLAYTIETLPESIDEVIFIVGHLKEQIMNFFGKRYAGKKISYVEQKNLNGTGGAIMLVQDIVKGKFLVLMGDDLYLKSDLEKLLQNDMGLLAMEAEDASQCAVVKLTEDGALDSIIEVPHTDRKGLMNTGAYVLNEKFFDFEPVSKALGSKEYGLPQTLVKVAQKHPVAVVKISQWHPLTNPDHLTKAEEIIDDFT